MHSRGQPCARRTSPAHSRTASRGSSGQSVRCGVPSSRTASSLKRKPSGCIGAVTLPSGSPPLPRVWPSPNRGPHRSCRCALRRKIPASKHLWRRQATTLQRFCPNLAQPRSHLTQTKTPHLRGFYIGAPGFEPGTSPTRTMGKIPSADGKALQNRLLDFGSPPLRSSDTAVDSRGLGSEIELLPNSVRRRGRATDPIEIADAERCGPGPR
jgi:hypothetical protein